MDSSTVKIFKTLTITPFVCIILMFLFEILSASIASSRIKQDIRTALSNACMSFVQESYNNSSLGDVKASDGSTYISGKVYGNENLNTDKKKYRYFFYYTSGYDRYYNFLTNKSIIGKEKSLSQYYEDLGYLSKGLNFYKNNGASKTTEELIGCDMIDNMITPMNIGVPYIGTMDSSKNLDRAGKAVQSMFRWNLAQLESNCDIHNIKKDSNDNYNSSHIAVEKSGFRIYAAEANITGIEYSIYDSAVESDRKEVQRKIGINAEEFKDSTKSNRYIVIARVSYEVRVGYKGITNIGKIINFINKDNNYVYRTSNIASGNDEYIYFYNIM